jgi:hypothetical protein
MRGGGAAMVKSTLSFFAEQNHNNTSLLYVSCFGLLSFVCAKSGFPKKMKSLG